MRFLLDTSILLWSVAEEHKLNSRARELLSSSSSHLYLSSATAWEIAIKCSIGTLKLPVDSAVFIPAVIRGMGMHTLDISSAHAIEAERLPQHHRDPFDRMLVAQAKVEGMTLLTGDLFIRTFGHWNELPLLLIHAKAIRGYVATRGPWNAKNSLDFPCIPAHNV